MGKKQSISAFGIVSSILFGLPIAAMVSHYAGNDVFIPTLFACYAVAGVLLLINAIREVKENRKNA